MEQDGQIVSPAKPILRELALKLNVPLVNANGNPLNTRQLGTQVIRSIREAAEQLTAQYYPPVVSSSPRR